MIKRESISINTEFIKLEGLLKLTGVSATGGEAKERIQSGQVLVNNATCTQRGKKLRPGDTVAIDGQIFEIR